MFGAVLEMKSKSSTRIPSNFKCHLEWESDQNMPPVRTACWRPRVNSILSLTVDSVCVLFQRGTWALDQGQIRAEVVFGIAGVHRAVSRTAATAGHSGGRPALRGHTAGQRLQRWGQRNMRGRWRPDSPAPGQPQGECCDHSTAHMGKSYSTHSSYHSQLLARVCLSKDLFTPNVKPKSSTVFLHQGWIFVRCSVHHSCLMFNTSTISAVRKWNKKYIKEKKNFFFFFEWWNWVHKVFDN